MSQLFWDDGSPPDRLGCLAIPILRVPAGGKRLVWLLAPVRGLWTHYVRHRSYPCKKTGCAFCRDLVEIRWKGYAPVAHWRSNTPDGVPPGWFPAVQEFTENCKDLKGRADLVGKLLELARPGKKKNSPLHWQLAAASQQPKGEPPFAAFDVEPSLRKLYDDPGRHREPPVTAELPEATGHPEPRPDWAPAAAKGEALVVPATPEELAAFRAHVLAFGQPVPTNGSH